MSDPRRSAHRDRAGAASRAASDVTNSHSLQVLGVLIERPNARPDYVSSRTGLTLAQVDEAVRTLALTGLVSGDGETRRVAAPGPVLESAVSDMEQQLRRTRTEVEAVLSSYHRSQRAAAVDMPIEVLAGQDSLMRAVTTLQQSARTLLRGCDKPPYYGNRTAQTALQRRLMSAGVAFHSIYDVEVFRAPQFANEVRLMTAAGEQSRVLRSVPMKMLIADDTQAIVALQRPGNSVRYLLVHPSELLSVLIALFETLWRFGDPLPGMLSDDDILPARTRSVLTLLQAGATDQEMAQYLSVSQRTVEREVQRLMDALGASSRFQAGVLAMRRGLLGPDERG